METAGFVVRRAGESDFDGWLALHAAVAAEGRWIGRELPVDRDESERWFIGALRDPEPSVAFVAVTSGQQVGQLLLRTHAGIGDIGMAVDAAWRGGAWARR